MRRTKRCAIVTTGCCALAAALLIAAAPVAQPLTTSGRIAFRVDAERLIAILTVLAPGGHRQITEGLSSEPVAKFGFRFFEPPDSLNPSIPSDVRAGDRWIVHTAPGQTVGATAERIVGGNPGCSEAVGVLLTLERNDVRRFAALPARYFVAEPWNSQQVSQADAASSVASLPESTVTPKLRRTLERKLDELLIRELPNVRSGAEPGLLRMASSPVTYHQSWARERQRSLQGLARGRGRLSYDVQPFRLAPDSVPFFFVRATWRVGGQQAFAVALWMRGDDLEIIRSDLRPATWLTMFEFQGRISNEQLGLVLNVLDRDHDGWGEVLFAQGGYESLSVEELRLSPAGFQATGMTYSYGC